MILKLQRPLADKKGVVSACMGYNRSQKWFSDQIPLTPELRKLFGRYTFKIFVKATHRKDGILEIHERIPDQGW